VRLLAVGGHDALAQGEQAGGDQQQQGDGYRVLERFFQRGSEGCSQDTGRDRADHDVDEQHAVRVVQLASPDQTGCALQEMHPILPEIDQHGQQCAQVDGDRVDQTMGKLPAQPPGDQHQVAGAGDRQEFGCALNDAQDNSLQDAQKKSPFDDGSGDQRAVRLAGRGWGGALPTGT